MSRVVERSESSPPLSAPGKTAPTSTRFAASSFPRRRRTSSTPGESRDPALCEKATIAIFATTAIVWRSMWLVDQEEVADPKLLDTTRHLQMHLAEPVVAIHRVATPEQPRRIRYKLDDPAKTIHGLS